MSLTNSEKSFLPFLNQHYQKKLNKTNKNRLILLSSNNERSVNKLTTGPPPKSPPVDNDPWHLDGRKGQYLIIKQHKSKNVFIALTYSQITSQSFESRSAATAAMKIIRKSLITPIKMVIQNTITLQTLPEEVIQPQVHSVAPETSSLSDSKQRNSDETQCDKKIVTYRTQIPRNYYTYRTQILCNHMTRITSWTITVTVTTTQRNHRKRKRKRKKATPFISQQTTKLSEPPLLKLPDNTARPYYNSK